MHRDDLPPRDSKAAQPSPPRREGIVVMRPEPLSPSTFVVRDDWQGPVGSDWALAYAGAERTDSGVMFSFSLQTDQYHYH